MIKSLKKLLMRIIPQRMLGSDLSIKQRLTNLETLILALLDSPTYLASNDVGFNGQQFRKTIFKKLLCSYPFQTMVETGTCLGNTTGYMAEISGLPVWSAELDPRFAALARKRLVRFSNVRIENIDSRAFLRDLVDINLHQTFTFFYLDAHWNDDLPLREEVEFIAKKWSKFVIMVDDFAVPGDPGYKYDYYGLGMNLTPRYLNETLRRLDLIACYPLLSSDEESGAKRGCVVLTRNGGLANTLISTGLFR